MKTIHLSILLIFATIVCANGQIVDNEKYNSYQTVTYYDNLPERVLPSYFIDYYHNLGPDDIRKSYQVIKHEKEERGIYNITKLASKGFLSITYELQNNYLLDKSILKVEYIINGSLLNAENIQALLKLNKRKAKRAMFIKQDDSIIVTIIN